MLLARYAQNPSLLTSLPPSTSRWPHFVPCRLARGSSRAEDARRFLRDRLTVLESNLEPLERTSLREASCRSSSKALGYTPGMVGHADMTSAIPSVLVTKARRVSANLSLLGKNSMAPRLGRGIGSGDVPKASARGDGECQHPSLNTPPRDDPGPRESQAGFTSTPRSAYKFARGSVFQTQMGLPPRRRQVDAGL